MAKTVSCRNKRPQRYRNDSDESPADDLWSNYMKINQNIAGCSSTPNVPKTPLPVNELIINERFDDFTRTSPPTKVRPLSVASPNHLVLPEKCHSSVHVAEDPVQGSETPEMVAFETKQTSDIEHLEEVSSLCHLLEQRLKRFDRLQFFHKLRTALVNCNDMSCKIDAQAATIEKLTDTVKQLTDSNQLLTGDLDRCRQQESVWKEEKEAMHSKIENLQRAVDESTELANCRHNSAKPDKLDFPHPHDVHREIRASCSETICDNRKNTAVNSNSSPTDLSVLFFQLAQKYGAAIPSNQLPDVLTELRAPASNGKLTVDATLKSPQSNPLVADDAATPKQNVTLRKRPNKKSAKPLYSPVTPSTSGGTITPTKSVSSVSTQGYLRKYGLLDEAPAPNSNDFFHISQACDEFSESSTSFIASVDSRSRGNIDCGRVGRRLDSNSRPKKHPSACYAEPGLITTNSVVIKSPRSYGHAENIEKNAGNDSPVEDVSGGEVMITKKKPSDENHGTCDGWNTRRVVELSMRAKTPYFACGKPAGVYMNQTERRHRRRKRSEHIDVSDTISQPQQETGFNRKCTDQLPHISSCERYVAVVHPSYCSNIQLLERTLHAYDQNAAAGAVSTTVDAGDIRRQQTHAHMSRSQQDSGQNLHRRRDAPQNHALPVLCTKPQSFSSTSSPDLDKNITSK